VYHCAEFGTVLKRDAYGRPYFIYDRASTDERMIKAGSQHLINSLRSDAITFADERAARANAEQTIENLREQLQDCTCKCQCEEHTNQAGCKHAETSQRW